MQRATPPPTASTPPVPTASETRCATCHGQGYVTLQVDVDDPRFGKAFDCPDCGGGVDRLSRRRAGLAVQFGEVWMMDSPKLHQFDMVDFLELPDELKRGKLAAIDAAYDWSRGDGARFLVLSGEPGLGKTCLASAAFVYRTIYRLGLPIEYNALMNQFLSLVRDDGNPHELIQVVARVPILLLDDLGNTFMQGAETPGRQRWLFEVINYRYNNDLPTLITTNLGEQRLYDQFDMKLADRIIEVAKWVDMKPPALRFLKRNEAQHD